MKQLINQKLNISSSGPKNRWPLIAWAVPVVCAGGLTLTYFAAPEFYLEYVLREEVREGQLVEIVTFVAALIGGALMLFAALRVWIVGGNRLGAMAIAVIGLAAIFFAGEEVSWGQTWFHWATPDALREVNRETNLHNRRDLGLFQVQSLGSVFLILAFFGLPIAWRLRERFRLPASLRPAVAEAPVIFAMAVAFAWKELKSIYILFDPSATADTPGMYGDFVEQFNEIKEMLTAVALLMYGLYCLRTTAKWINDRSHHDSV